jgi:ureidoglycolate lyase
MIATVLDIVRRIPPRGHARYRTAQAEHAPREPSVSSKASSATTVPHRLDDGQSTRAYDSLTSVKATSAPLPLRPLTREGFAPFGLVVGPTGTPVRVNEESALRYDAVAHLENLRTTSATLNIAYFDCSPRTLPFDVRVVEKHPMSAQLFVPMNAARYVVVVAAEGETPGQLHAFLAEGTQGIAYHPGIWHHTLMALDQQTAFTCFVWEDGTELDCTVHTLAEDETRRVTIER